MPVPGVVDGLLLRNAQVRVRAGKRLEIVCLREEKRPSERHAE